METTAVNIRRVIVYAGAFIAFLIGSGFATGQEVMQYFSAYGWAGTLGILVVFLLFLYVGYEFVVTGREQRIEHSGDIYRHYCGKAIGTFFDYFSVLFIYMSFIVMMGGTGATVEQQYGISPWIGALCMGVAAALTVIYGLDRIVNVLGNVGPAIVVLTILLGVWAIFRHPEGLDTVDSVLPALLESKQINAVSDNWFYASLSYVGFCMLWLAGFMSMMGNRAHNLKEVKAGAVLGALGFSLALLIIAVGFMANVEFLAGSKVPTLKMAGSIHSAFATVFSVIVLAGIYTTAVPLLWQASARFTGGKGNTFKIVTIVLMLIGVFIGLKIDFTKLVNVIYGINGYVGFLLMFFMIINTAKRFKNRRA